MDLIKLMLDNLALSFPGASRLDLLKCCELLAAEMQHNGGDMEAAVAMLDATLTVESAAGTPWAVNILTAAEKSSK